ncbi:MAG: DNA mismatch repair endonuclease MutL [Clostridia bacterium]|nr:DNA mismatch repair endonuclease MutL [Clostridia bacterium]
MPKINVLPKHLAELIAAGEVVERPASVIKELIENSIDAGSTSITVEIKHGGITYIRITDNGCGIEREDVSKAFLSHATSKIAIPDDLASIGTLGFRGEALASIAAVSKTEIITKTVEEQIGTRCVVVGSEQVEFDDAGCPQGTTIVVRDIFYNTPARMKFLKKDVTEGNAVAAVVDRLALSHPEIGIRFIRDSKETLLTPGDGKLESAIYAVFGKEFSQGLISTDYELNGIGVSGFISKPLASRSNRSMQFFFLNGRLVKSQTATAAIEQSYKNSIMVGKFPSCVLNIVAPYESVDVNVHPAKTQVRFENEKKIFDAVYYAVKSSLDKKDTPAQVDLSKLKSTSNFASVQKSEQIAFAKKNEDFWQTKKASDYTAVQNKPQKKEEPIAQEIYKTFLAQPPQAEYKTKNDEEPQFVKKRESNVINNEPLKQVEVKENLNNQQNLIQELPIQDEQQQPINSASQEINFKIIGEAFKTYIIVELDKKLLIIDKHAAHERMIYEQLKSNQKLSNTQLLLSPVTVTVSKEEYSVLMDSKELLSNAGFELDDFGAGTVVVRECPVELGTQDITQMVQELAGYLLSNREPVLEQLDWIYHSTACRAAIKAGDKTSDYELLHFVKTLLSNESIRYCPHGRPVFIQMTKSELEKQFGRL